MKNPYLTLELSENASMSDVDERYHYLALAFHPDKFRNPHMKKQAEEDFKVINEAYQAIKAGWKPSDYHSYKKPKPDPLEIRIIEILAKWEQFEFSEEDLFHCSYLHTLISHFDDLIARIEKTEYQYSDKFSANPESDLKYFVKVAFCYGLEFKDETKDHTMFLNEINHISGNILIKFQLLLELCRKLLVVGIKEKNELSAILPILLNQIWDYGYNHSINNKMQTAGKPKQSKEGEKEKWENSSKMKFSTEKKNIKYKLKNTPIIRLLLFISVVLLITILINIIKISKNNTVAISNSVDAEILVTNNGEYSAAKKKTPTYTSTIVSTITSTPAIVTSIDGYTNEEILEFITNPPCWDCSYEDNIGDEHSEVLIFTRGSSQFAMSNPYLHEPDENGMVALVVDGTGTYEVVLGKRINIYYTDPFNEVYRFILNSLHNDYMEMTELDKELTYHCEAIYFREKPTCIYELWAKNHIGENVCVKSYHMVVENQEGYSYMVFGLENFEFFVVSKKIDFSKVYKDDCIIITGLVEESDYGIPYILVTDESQITSCSQ